jgi:hypothetical protein
MLGRTMMAVCVVMLISGCGGGDPENAVLGDGTAATVEAGKTPVMLTKEDGMTSLGVLPPGTKVTVEHDPGELKETEQDMRMRAVEDKQMEKVIRKEGPKTFPASDPLAKRRQIRVKVGDGPLQGTVGQVRRFQLRVAK